MSHGPDLAATAVTSLQDDNHTFHSAIGSKCSDPSVLLLLFSYVQW